MIWNAIFHGINDMYGVRYLRVVIFLTIFNSLWHFTNVTLPMRVRLQGVLLVSNVHFLLRRFVYMFLS